MKKPRMTAALTAVLCLAGAGVLLTSYAQQNTAVKSGAAKLYRQNCARCHGACGEGGSACCIFGTTYWRFLSKQKQRQESARGSKQAIGHLKVDWK